MSQGTTRLDISTLTRAVEEQDARTLSAFYADDATLLVVDRDNPPSRPRTISGREAMAAYYDDVCGRAMTHKVEGWRLGPLASGVHRTLRIPRRNPRFLLGNGGDFGRPDHQADQRSSLGWIALYRIGWPHRPCAGEPVGARTPRGEWDPLVSRGGRGRRGEWVPGGPLYPACSQGPGLTAFPCAANLSDDERGPGPISEQKIEETTETGAQGATHRGRRAIAQADCRLLAAYQPRFASISPCT